MYTVINHIRVVPEHREAFEARFRESIRRMHAVPGFLRVDVWRPSPHAKPEADYPSDAYMIQTVWTDHAAFRGWVGSEAFRASHANPMPDAWRAGPAMMSQHEHAFVEVAGEGADEGLAGAGE